MYKKEKTLEDKPKTKAELLKYEIAEELGLMEKIKDTGWKSLTARESGRIGGIITTRKKEERNKTLEN